MILSSSQLAGTEPIFLLRIDFLGQIWRFSTYPIEIDGYEYIGGLADFEFVESSDLLGVNIDSNSLSVQVDFIGLDLVHEWRKGRTLEGCEAELSYMLIKNDILQGELDDRVILLDGIIQSPVFGDPLESLGTASFSVERKPFDTSRLILDDSQTINVTTFPNHDQDTAGGKFYPIVIGEPGITRNDGGVQIKIFSTPTYNVRAYTFGGDIFFLIAGHEVMATRVRMRDGAGNVESFDVLQGFDSIGQVYSYVQVPVSSSIMYPGRPSISSNAESPTEFWLCWFNGGGLRNPYGDGVLTGGADVCRWALSRSKMPIDYGAWANIAPILNTFKFSGYINEPVSSWDWLNENILPYLPIEIRAGKKGLRPVLAQLYAYNHVLPVAQITAAPDFSRVSAITTETDTADIVNSFSLSFAKQGHEQKFAMTIKIAKSFTPGDSERGDIFSEVSVNRYGLKEASGETNYIYDRPTALRAAHIQIKSSAFPLRTIRFQAAMYYGFLQIGDVIELSSSELYLEDTKCTIISKSWSVHCWMYEIGFFDNPILIDRST